jgi:tetratricopeptide (TPR) repeat protein
MTAGFTRAARAGSRGQAEQFMGDWAAAARDIETASAGIEKAGKAALPDVVRTRNAFPNLAIDYAKLGDTAKAKTLIAQTPLDCTVCLFARGVVAENFGDRRSAAYWFARADAFGPSFPYVPLEWGRMLIASGDAKASVAKFADAARRSPHFADPLEGWGEALMAQNRSDLALAKFDEASKYAPNWGRLHLKWAEALHYTGKQDEARKQLARASSLFMTPAEKSERARMEHRHG